MAPSLKESLAAGDPAAFAALYDRLAGRLLSTARIMTASPADAEDIVHDLFVELARHRTRLAAVTDLEAYVFTMLRHAVSRCRRRAAIDRRAVVAIGRHRGHDGLTSAAPVAVPDDQLQAAVAALPDAQREVVALRFHGGLTFAEIAAAMGTSLNTAASRYRYAIDKLRSLMQQKDGFP
ncbi:MAG: sigma-70 family RNA polymerase sigma factor [Planctomycetota bacterium]|nr:sigma-70 family RNA polymerase sigma factor [Planctomycetota bacterium]